MYKLLLFLLLLLVINASFAQKPQRIKVADLPLENDKLVYKDSINVPGKSQVLLDSAAKKWFYSNFKLWRLIPQKGIDTANTILGQGVLTFRRPANTIGLVTYTYYLIITIKISCTDNYYTYKISDMYFSMTSRFLNSVVNHPDSVDNMIGLYKNKKKHWLFMPIARSTIDNYLSYVNASVNASIASLNKTMTSQ